MNRRDKIVRLLEALSQKRSAIVKFHRRCGRYGEDLLERAMDEAADRIHKRAWRTFKPQKGTAKSYVGTIARRASIFVIGKLNKQRPLRSDFDAGTNEFNPADILTRRQEIADAHEALRRLSSRDRKTLLQWAKQQGRRPSGIPSTKNSAFDTRVFRAKDRFLSNLITIRTDRIRACASPPSR
jgi:DNA-directed RNA polymerase specialized sigma24 family protein